MPTGQILFAIHAALFHIKYGMLDTAFMGKMTTHDMYNES